MNIFYLGTFGRVLLKNSVSTRWMLHFLDSFNLNFSDLYFCAYLSSHNILVCKIILNVLQWQSAPCNSFSQVTQRQLLAHPEMAENKSSSEQQLKLVKFPSFWYVVFTYDEQGWCTVTLKYYSTGSKNFSMKMIWFCIFRFTKTRYQIIAGFLTLVLTVAAEAHHSFQKVTILRILWDSPF